MSRRDATVTGRAHPARRTRRAHRASTPVDAPEPPSEVSPSVWEDHVRIAHHRDPAALDRLVAEYHSYAASLARRQYRGGESLEDLVQIALEALVVALKRFEPERRLPFPAFATPTILGALRRHYRDHGWLVRVPRRIHELAVRQRAVADELVARLGRQPTIEEVATEMGTDVDTVLLVEDAVHARTTSSIDGGLDGAEGTGVVLADPREPFARTDERLAIAEALVHVDDGDRQLLQWYFLEERSQSSIAADLGVSQMQVSRLLAGLVRRLRSYAAART